MSPRKSDADRIAAIEALVCRDVGRKTAELIAASAGELAAAGRSLGDATRVGLITGFFVPRGEVAAPETDGPVGTALLAVALAACGVPTRIAVDTPCAAAVRAAVDAAGGGVAVDEVGVAESLDRLIADWRRAGVSHAVAIERCGRSADGRPRNMRGVDVSPWTAPLDDLFLACPWIRLAVGDGGNEIGMGKLPPGLIARTVPNGDKIACVTSCDQLVVAGVSNWGAYGLMAALAVARPDWAARIATFLTAERDLTVTRATVDKAGAVDGVTALREATVDGFGPEIHGPLIDELGRIARGQAAD
jgi:D-glutamate cyclase